MNAHINRSRLALAVALLGASGCDVNINLPGDPDPAPPVASEEYEPTDEEEPYVPVETPGTPLSECVPEVDWVTYRPNDYGVGVNNLQVTPNDGLIVRTDDTWSSQSLVFRADTGDLLAESWEHSFRAADRAFTKRLMLMWNGIEVREMITGDLIASYAFEAETAQLEAGTLSRDGSRVAALSCGTQEGRRLHIIGADSGIEEQTFFLDDLSEWCSGTYDPHAAVKFTHDGSAVVIGIDDKGVILHLDLDTGEEFRVVAHPPVVPEEGEWVADLRALLNFTISPDDDRVVTTGADGRLHMFKLPNLVDAGVDMEVGQQLVNTSAYLPQRLVSPVEFSHDGKLIVFMGADGKAYLADAADFSDQVCLEIELEMPEDTAFWPEGHEFRPVGFTFARDSEAVVAYYGQAIASFSCGGAGPNVGHSHPLAVDLDVPGTVDRGVSTQLTATHFGAPDIHAHSFYIDGEPIQGGGLGRTTTWYPSEVGTYEVTVVVDDGVNTGSATRTVEVIDN